MVEWNEFDDISDLLSNWLPSQGEGDNMATQASTAINKLVFKWYNDADVYDNNYNLEGWCNDLSSYANWLYNYLNICELMEITNIYHEREYEDLLFRIASKFTSEMMEKLEKEPKKGSIYTEEGPFSFSEYEEDDEWEEDEW